MLCRVRAEGKPLLVDEAKQGPARGPTYTRRPCVAGPKAIAHVRENLLKPFEDVTRALIATDVLCSRLICRARADAQELAAGMKVPLLTGPRYGTFGAEQLSDTVWPWR